MIKLNIGSRKISIFHENKSIVVYLHADETEGLRIAEMVDGAVIVAIDGIDWNHDLTPWPGKSVFRRQPDFGGGAGDYLRELTGEIVPLVERSLGYIPKKRILAGYSLAGLFAVWAGMNTDCFDGIASVSGSLWYPGFADYAKRAQFFSRAAYFSVGDREKLGRIAVFHTIEEDTRRVSDELRKRGVKAIFELNPGGHFVNSAERTARGIEWVRNQLIAGDKDNDQEN